MIRVSETMERFEVRAERLAALLRDAGVSQHGPRMARPPFLRGLRNRLPGNMVIEWLRAKQQPLCDYLADLIRFDICLRRSLGNLHRECDEMLRLALALFIDFAHTQGLKSAELAALMHDVPNELLDAMEFLVLQAAHDRASSSPPPDERTEAWGDAPTVAF